METCFVIMPIGDQEIAGVRITAAELKSRYDDLIKEALTKANPDLQVTRADDFSGAGTITTDIIVRLMQSDFVLADITYPNFNVFYELGLRHASRLGTVIIREKSGPASPFDVAHLRHILYENTPSGLKQLAENLASYFAQRRANPESPDNAFQELAQVTHFLPQSYGQRQDEDDLKLQAMMAMFQAPEIMELAIKAGDGPVDPMELLQVMTKNPAAATNILQALFRSGQIDFGNGSTTQSSAKTPPRRNRRASK